MYPHVSNMQHAQLSKSADRTDPEYKLAIGHLLCVKVTVVPVKPNKQLSNHPSSLPCAILPEPLLSFPSPTLPFVHVAKLVSFVVQGKYLPHRARLSAKARQ